MKIALVTPWDVDDPQSWSGVVRPMVRSLREAAEVDVVPCGQERPSILDRVAAGVSGRLSRRTYLTGHAVATARLHGRALTERLAGTDHDVVLGITASAPLAYTRTDRPVVQVTDATFGAITDYYPLYTDLPTVVRRQGEIIERRSAAHTQRWVVASTWAAQSLVHDYGAAPERVQVAPFGSALQEFSERSPFDGVVRALLVCSNWARKGGPAALEAVELARAAGTDVRLTVVGEHPPLPAYVEGLGRLPRRRMPDLYAQHDVLLELAAANAGGVTLTDAAHAGLPAIATRTGGVSDIVHDGVSGFLVPDGPGGVAVAAQRLTDMSVPGLHADLVAGAREHAREALSWDHWAHGVLQACNAAVAEASRSP